MGGLSEAQSMHELAIVLYPMLSHGFLLLFVLLQTFFFGRFRKKSNRHIGWYILITFINIIVAVPLSAFGTGLTVYQTHVRFAAWNFGGFLVLIPLTWFVVINAIWRMYARKQQKKITALHVALQILISGIISTGIFITLQRIDYAVDPPPTYPADYFDDVFFNGEYWEYPYSEVL